MRKDAQNPQSSGVSHLKRVPGPGPVPVHLCPLPADLQGQQGEFRGQARRRGCCRAVEEEMLLLPCGRPRAREAAPGSGAPPRGCLLYLEESAAFTASLPDSPPSLLHFSPLPCLLLPWGPSLGEGGGRLPLPSSCSCLCRMERGDSGMSTPILGGKAQLSVLGLIWLVGHCWEWGVVGKEECHV